MVGRGMADSRAALAAGAFEQLRAGCARPAAERDRVYRQRLEPLGLLAPGSPYRDPGAGLAAVLRDGLAAGRDRLETVLMHDLVRSRTARGCRGRG
jgi:hypothetical protein